MRATNWAGNITYSAHDILEPTSVDNLQQMVAENERVKALGSRHAFSPIADTDGVLISTARLTDVAISGNEATVDAGVRYGDLSSALRPHGLALANLASLPHISVAGACATGTHGSGVHNRNLSSAVTAMELVLADGSLQTIRQGDVDFEGAVVHLGALGIVTRLTLRLEPAYSIWQTVYDNLPLDTLSSHFPEVMASGTSVSLFTTWSSDVIDQVWVKSRTPNPDVLFGAQAAPVKRHPLRGMPSDFCTDQGNVPGSWDERLPHFKMEFTPSSGEELQSEFFVPANRAIEALDEVRALAPQITPHLHVSEIRWVAADTLWMSPAYGQDVIGIHLTWKKEPHAVMALLPHIEARLAPLEVRPHWAKLTTMTGVGAAYPRVAQFQALRHRRDPHGKFNNAYLARLLG